MSTITNNHPASMRAWHDYARQQAAAGQTPWLPLTNAAAVFAAVANLATAGSPCASFRPLRVSPTWVTQFDHSPVVPVGLPGCNQIREGMSGLAWPIYSRDMPVAKGCLTFLHAMVKGADLPLLSEPKQESGLYQALMAGAMGPTAPGIGPHAVAPAMVNDGAVQGAAIVWVQRVEAELVNGEPVQHPPRPIVVRLDCTLPEMVADFKAYVFFPSDAPELADLPECILDRLTKQRMRGRKAGVPNKPKATPPTGPTGPTPGPGDATDGGGTLMRATTAEEWDRLTQHAQAAEAEVAQLQGQLRDMATTYAQQLQALATGGVQGVPVDQPAAVPVERAAGYLVSVIKMLPPDASQAEFQVLAGRINSDDPELFRAIAVKLQGA